MESNSEERFHHNEDVIDDFHDLWLKNHPSALSSFEEIKSMAYEKQMVVFLDYDGTLSPIVNNPDQAFMSTEMRSAVREIGEHFPTAIISGRSRDKVFQFVRLNNIYYAGSHGMDISTPSVSLNYGNRVHQTRTIDEKGNDMVNFCPVQDFLPRIQTIKDKLEKVAKDIKGASVEDNKFCLSVHFRCVNEENVGKLKEMVESTMEFYNDFRISEGKKKEILGGVNLREGISAVADKFGAVAQSLDDSYLHLHSTFMVETNEKLFHCAVKGKWNEVVDICSNHLFLTFPITKSNDTVFHLAAYNNQEETLIKLLNLLPREVTVTNPALRRTNNKGNTLLHTAASVGSVNMCRSIIEADTRSIIDMEADSTKSSRIQRIQNNKGETALFLAAFHGHKDAFLYLHSICGPKVGYHYCKRKDKETILHRAITEEYYELSLIILRLYKDLVNLPNEKGMTPLHLLAKKSSAFKSGSDLRWLENIIYHSFPETGELELFRVADKVNLERPKVSYGGHPSPNGAQWHHQLFKCKIYFDFVKLVSKAASSIYAFSRKCADIENPEGPHFTQEGDPSPNGAQAQEVQLPPNHRTSSLFEELVSKAVLYIFGSSEMGRNVWMKKVRHTWSILIMNELVQNASLYKFPRGETLFPSEYPVVPDHAKEFPTKDESNPYDITYCPYLHEKQGIQLIYSYFDDFPPEKIDLSETQAISPTPVLIAAMNGITEMVEKILENYPIAMYEMHENKNIVLLTVEQKQPYVYELLLSLKQKGTMKDSVFFEVDCEGNSALHLAATKAKFDWPVPGAASQMQWEIKWYEYIKKTMPKRFLLLHNNHGQTPEEFFTENHEDLVKNGREWLTSTLTACSVVTSLFVTSTYTTSTTVPGGVKQEDGTPYLEHKPAFQVFAISSFFSFYSSLIAVVMFLSILTSGCAERDFRYALPGKLLLGLTAFYMSLASTLVSFSTGHFFILKDLLKSAAFPLYVGVCLLVTFFSIAVFPLYFHLAWATIKKVPQRNYRVIPRWFYFKD